MAKTKKTSKNKELEQKLQRVLADYQNLEKRFRKESSHVIRFANTSLLTRILDINDNLERANITIKDSGLDMVLSQINKLLVEEMVSEISAKGEEFDPTTMEAEDTVKGAKNKVIKVVQKGYMLSDRILRPAKVLVGGGKSK